MGVERTDACDACPWLVLVSGCELDRQPATTTTTPHALRRTYISIALLANNFDVKWVMRQVGHADSKMTLDVYAQLEQRVDRTHGTSFDAFIIHARTHAGDTTDHEARDDRHRFRTTNGTKTPGKPPRPRPNNHARSEKTEKPERCGFAGSSWYR